MGFQFRNHEARRGVMRLVLRGWPLAVDADVRFFLRQIIRDSPAIKMMATGTATPIPVLAPVDSPLLKFEVSVDVELVAREVDRIVVFIKVPRDAPARNDYAAAARLLQIAGLVSAATIAAERNETKEASSADAAPCPRSDDSAATILLRMAVLVSTAATAEVRDASWEVRSARTALAMIGARTIDCTVSRSVTATVKSILSKQEYMRRGVEKKESLRTTGYMQAHSSILADLRWQI